MAESAWVGLGVEPFEALADSRVERVRGQQPSERRLRGVPPAADAGAGVGLLDQMQDRLEQVVVAPHLVIQHVQGGTLFGGVEAGLPEIRSDQRGVLLLDEAVVVLLVRP